MKPRTGKLEDEYAWAAECNLATLSGLMGRKRSPKCEIDRQTSICHHMVTVCFRHFDAITWQSGVRGNYPRVHDLLIDNDSPPNIERALERFKESCR